MASTEIQETTADVLEDLATDMELQNAVQTLESLYFERLDHASDLDPITRYRLDRARDALAVAQLAIQRLVQCKDQMQ